MTKDALLLHGDANGTLKSRTSERTETQEDC
jgi:hypothetical protein